MCAPAICRYRIRFAPRCGCFSPGGGYSRNFARPRRDAPMHLQLHDRAPALSEGERLEYARQIIRAEALALEEVAGRLDDSFLEVVGLVYRCAGRVAVTGTGKSADVGQKIAGTL